MHARNQKSGVGRFFTYLIEYLFSNVYISLMTTEINYAICSNVVF